ncbi:MAG: hypothetical protein E2O29_01715 [Deltaproteobacteria bacterium]|nr:MAG: hypothetical protein E2O29_01715 [Deltaproteobacteria bacterium]
MRQLTVKQKKYIVKLPIERTTVNDVTLQEWTDLQKMNDTEVLYQAVNNYLMDRTFNRNYGIKKKGDK